MPVDPQTDFGTSRLTAGYKNFVQFTVPETFEVVTLLLTAANISSNRNRPMTVYAYNPPVGARQKTVHSRGTKEINWSVTGELTQESDAIVRFLSPSMRGRLIPSLRIQQGAISKLIVNAPWESFSMTASPGGNVGVTLAGKSLAEPTDVAATHSIVDHMPIPAWATGSLGVKSWNLSHSVSLQAQYHNTTSMFPAYYRPGESEYNFSVEMLSGENWPSSISLGINRFSFTEAILVSSETVLGGMGDPTTFRATLTTANTGLGQDLSQSYSPLDPFAPFFPQTQSLSIRDSRSLDQFKVTVALTSDSPVPDAWPDGV